MRRPHPLRSLLREYEWVHLTLGILGNTCFVIGSFLFLSDSTRTLGTWLFVAGSSGMWIGTTGSAIVSLERHRARRRREHREATADQRAPAR